MDFGVEGGEDGVALAGALAEHFALPLLQADALFHGDGIVDGDKAITAGFGDAFAIGPEWAGFAVAVWGAASQDFEEAPADDGGADALGVFEDAVHEAEGGVEGGEGFDGAGDGSC